MVQQQQQPWSPAPHCTHPRHAGGAARSRPGRCQPKKKTFREERTPGRVIRADDSAWMPGWDPQGVKEGDGGLGSELSAFVDDVACRQHARAATAASDRTRIRKQTPIACVERGGRWPITRLRPFRNPALTAGGQHRSTATNEVRHAAALAGATADTPPLRPPAPCFGACFSLPRPAALPVAWEPMHAKM